MATRVTWGRALVGSLELKNGAVVLDGAGAPTDGTSGTGAGIAGPGSLYIDTTNKKLYQNTNTEASPTWQSIGEIIASEIALADGKLLVGNASGAAEARTVSGDITISNTGVAAIGADKVLSAMVEKDLLRYADVQLTNAEILALRATPITLVGAPGANRAVLVHAVYFVLDAAAGAYTETADNLAVEYASGVDILTIETTGLVDSAAVSLGRVAPAVALTVPAVVANSAVRLFNNGDGEFGGGNAANTLSVRVYYSVVDTIAFS